MGARKQECHDEVASSVADRSRPRDDDRERGAGARPAFTLGGITMIPDSGTFACAGAPVVLFVDGDPGSRTAYAEAARKAGLDAYVAGSALEGLAMTKVLSVDAIVTEMQLPDLDGCELVRRLADSPRSHDIPVVALVAERSDRLERQLRARGCSAVLRKPSVFVDLVDLLGLLLERPRARARGRRG